MQDPEAQEGAGPWLAVLEAAAPRPLTLAEISRRAGEERFDRRAMRRSLDELVAGGRLRRIGPTRYQWRSDPPVARTGRRTAPLRGGPYAEGRYTRARGGFGFVAAAGTRGIRGDILIPRGREGGALHGDRVRVQYSRRGAGRTSGRVVEVLERAHERVVGTLEWRAGRRGPKWWLVPESEQLPVIEIPGAERLGEGDAGRLAVARIREFPRHEQPAWGEVERVLGDGDDPEVQVLSIALEHGLRIEFPRDVEQEATALPHDPAPRDHAGRRDLRSLPFVTIDGETARDFDDAVQLEPVDGGRERLRVAIADVSHYVRPGSPLDREAAARGTSVYFPDRALPMLPERLSSELCSLMPERDRLVMVAEVELDAEARPTKAQFYRAVIRSRARLTYTQVAAVLSDADAPQVRRWREELVELLPQLRAMHGLMRRLYRRRLAAGSLDLDLPEAMIDLSEEGRAIGVSVAPRNDAHRMIEEMMLAANRAVASYLTDADVPFPYRVHEAPDAQEIEELNRYLHFFGQHVESGGRQDGAIRPASVQRVLTALQGHPLERVLSRRVLRALKQAHYDVHNEGHFGLAFPIYCHFTSPIRRYPDLVVHRQLGLLLDGRADEASGKEVAIASASTRASEAERSAMEAERAMLDLKKAEFMIGHLLEPEPATVVSVTRFGFFVELEAYPVDGLVPLESLSGYWTYDDEREILANARAGERVHLGDRFLVEATNASTRRRQVTFAVLERLATHGGGAHDRSEHGQRPRRRPESRRSEPRRGSSRSTRPRRSR